jgi:hypothetical protein
MKHGTSYKKLYPGSAGNRRKIISDLSLHPDITERTESARQAMNGNNKIKGWHIYSERDFFIHVFMQGLLKIKYETLSKLTKKQCEVYKKYT